MRIPPIGEGLEGERLCAAIAMGIGGGDSRERAVVSRQPGVRYWYRSDSARPLQPGGRNIRTCVAYLTLTSNLSRIRYFMYIHKRRILTSLESGGGVKCKMYMCVEFILSSLC